MATDSRTAAKRANITYRQLDHWIRQGYVAATTMGTGYPREMEHAEVRVVVLMAHLVASGLTVATAADIARIAIETAQSRVTRKGLTFEIPRGWM